MNRRAALVVTAIAALGTSCNKAAESQHHPLFFAIEKNGVTSYILGTIHRGVDAQAWLPAIVWNKLDAAPTFAMEADVNDPALQTAANRETGSLHEELGDVYWHKLEVAVGPTVAARLDHLTPFVAVATLVIKNLPDTPPMDGVLLQHAESEHKKVVYLETASKEIAVLVKWLTARTIKEILDDADDTKQVETDLLAAYLDGDGDAMARVQARERQIATKRGHSEAEEDEQQRDLIDDRNASWIAPIEKLHASGGGFIAVGALHLVGHKSVIELLAAKGYKVTRQ